MNTIRNIVSKHLSSSLIATMTLGMVLMAFPDLGTAQDYRGSEVCSDCHDSQIYNDWQTSGHSTILMEGMNAMHRSLPTPEDEEWSDISYVVGGHKTKTNYLDDEGYLITGSSQYNLLTGQWSDFFPGEVKAYDCGECHTTGYDTAGNPPGLPGIVGTFALPSVQCERCHGPGIFGDTPEHGNIKPLEASECGECHSHAAPETIAASGGFITSEGQYNEFLAGPHAGDIGGEHAFASCVNCHDPHKPAQFGLVKTCSDCHTSQASAYEGSIMSNAGVECVDCHMPPATLSAQALGPHEGDMRTHIFYINTDPAANMFTPDGSAVAKVDGKAAVTLDFVCQRCHGSASKEELAKFARDFHDPEKSLEDIGLDPGLTGTWAVVGRSGEGWLLEVGYVGGQLFVFITFYTYDGMGAQAYLIAQSTAIDGNTAELIVYMTEGGLWGDDFDPNDVDRPIFGTGTATFSTCGEGRIEITANEDALALGYSDVVADLYRVLDSGIACPTFVNDSLAAAAAR